MKKRISETLIQLAPYVLIAGLFIILFLKTNSTEAWMWAIGLRVGSLAALIIPCGLNMKRTSIAMLPCFLFPDSLHAWFIIGCLMGVLLKDILGKGIEHMESRHVL